MKGTLKMKKQVVFGLAAVFSLVASAAGVESSNTFGVMKVDAGAATGKRDVFISVPWIEVGNSDSAQTVNATNLVLASQLDEGDMLFVYGGGSTEGTFGAWSVQKSAGVTNWVAVTVSASDGPYVPGTKAGLNRGSGIVVQTAQRYIYLYGQYSSTANVLSIAPGDESRSYTLIGTQFAKDYDLNNGEQVVWAGTIDPGDYIITELGVEYTRTSTNTWQKWTGRYNTITTWGNTQSQMKIYTDEGVTIPQGRGAWYARKGTGPLTIQFLDYVEE